MLVMAPSHHGLKKYVVIILIIIGTMIGVTSSGFAQAADQTGFSQYKISYWTTDDGLPGNTMVSICQDTDGYLWIGSYQGLIRFDGNKFIDFNDSNTPGLVSHHIRMVISDKDGNLWLGTGSGLVLYSKGRFTNMATHDTEFFIENMSLDSINNKLWIGTRSGGLFSFDMKSNQYTKVESIFSDDLIYAVEHDNEGGVWVGGGKNGLGHYKNGEWTYFKEETGLAEVNCIYLDGNVIYIGTPFGLYVKDENGVSQDERFDNIPINNVTRDRNGNLWVLTAQGIFKVLKNNRIEQINNTNGLSNNDVRDIHFDNDGSAWIATYRGGLNQLKETKFLSLTQLEGINAEVIRSIDQYSKDKYVAVSTDGKMYFINETIVKPYNLKTQLSRVYDLMIDEDQNIWIASFSGLLLLTTDGNETLFTEKNGLPTRQLRVLFKDSHHNFWIGTQNNGIIKIDFTKKGNRFKIDKYQGVELNSPFIMAIDEDDKGNLLISTNTDGINVIKPDGRIDVYNKSSGLLSNLVFNTYTDQEGVIWVATSNGISRVEKGKSFNYVSENGLPQESVFDIAEDSLGYLWMSSAKGIIRVKKQEMIDYRDSKIESISWKIYGKNDELRKSECSGTASMFTATDGSLWVPMYGGIVAVYPTSITKNEKPPKVFIEKISVDNQDLNIDKPIVIPPNNQRLVITYTGLSLRYPNTNLYKYRLKNFDRNWNEAGPSRQIVYTNLPKGSYTFEVTACNNDGVWNNTGATISFVVEPYFYETIWFYTLVFLSVGIGMIAFTRWRTSEVKQQNIELEKEVQKRVFQLKQKSDSLEEENREKTSILNIVSHDLKAPFSKIKGLADIMRMSENLSKEEKEEYLDHIINSIEQGNYLIRNLLDAQTLDRESNKPIISEIDLVEFMNDFQLSASAQLLRKQQTLKMQLEIPEKKFLIDPQMLTRILDNLVSNASKFSNKGKPIYLRVWEENMNLNFSVRDEGPGISEEDQRKMFRKFQMLTARPTAGEGSTGLGLTITKALVEKLKGSISVSSKLGEGTEFVISFPNK